MTENCNDKQQDRFELYQLLWHYYRGDLLNLTVREWATVTAFLSSKPTLSQNDWGAKAINLLETINNQSLETFPFDFNRLFVGPNKLLASPYESSYRNTEGTVMQTETLKVRNFYYHEGLQVDREGQHPDDHLQFELEFILHLIQLAEKKEILRLFLHNHLLKWYEAHCRRIEEHSQNVMTLAFAYLLRGFLQKETMLLKEEEAALC
ncbi:molecular chaperone [Neobacillus niacini]|uniref:TorD/DmsD family molecular chaperone n=1 Tax=Neobacillus niacini TaxID=86668 RepID=UPI0021CAF532|nr:molecular chaperone TorD family protein [Neobacillus niacini]MCM3768473.1 molecular chaperone TorD family protein [Neobacillus niacini]